MKKEIKQSDCQKIIERKTKKLIKDFETASCKDNFGHNICFDFLPVFKKLLTLDVETKIKIIDYYTVEIFLPGLSDTGILLFILTELPGCSEVNYSNKKNKLTLSWHF